MGAPRVYGFLLRLLPRELRQRFGPDMSALFSHRLSRARSAPERGWVWARGITDVLTHSVLDRLKRVRRGGNGRGGGSGTWTVDVHWAFRSLRRSPLLSGVAVLTLTLGIGASTATFTVVDNILLKGMPYRDSDRLVVVWPETVFNTAMVAEVSAAVPALEMATGVSVWNLTLTGVGEPVEVKASRVSPNHFRVLGVSPALGRGFEPADGLPGAPGVVILSHGF